MHLQACRRRFREFGTISGTYIPKPAIFKTMGFRPGFLLEIGRFRTLLGIHPKSLRTIPQTVRNAFASTVATFERVWDDFWHLPKSVILKTIARNRPNVNEMLVCGFGRKHFDFLKQYFYCRPWIKNSFWLVQWILSNITVMTDPRRPIPTCGLSPIVSVDGMTCFDLVASPSSPPPQADMPRAASQPVIG